MTKRELFLLLLPSVIFMTVAFDSFRSARTIAPDEQFTHRMIDKLTGEAKSGDYGPNPDLLVERLSDSWRSRDVIRADQAKLHTLQGWGIVAGIVIQWYVIFRMKSKSRSR